MMHVMQVLSFLQDRFDLPYITEEELIIQHIDGLVQERRNSSALAMELCLFLHKPIDMKAFQHFLQTLYCGFRNLSSLDQVMACSQSGAKP